MHNSVAKRWADALRSGQYQQGHGALRTRDDQFCCLGVLCQVVAPDGWTLDEETWHSTGEVYRSFGEVDIPPISILVEAGLTHSEAHKLATLNDSCGLTFSEIADIVEGDNIDTAYLDTIYPDPPNSPTDQEHHDD